MNETRKLSKKRVIAFAPRHDSPGHNDASKVFRPEAETFVGLSALGSRLVLFDNRKHMAARAKQVMDALHEDDEEDAYEDAYDAVAFFCHGWRDGIQAGFRRGNIPRLASAIYNGTSFGAFILLYCCSTAEKKKNGEASGTGDDSFADKLRDALCQRQDTNCRVMAHSTRGHATSNPNVVFKDGMGSHLGGAGGYPPVSKGSTLWRPWRRALADRKSGTLRFRAPFMSVEDLHRELAEGLQ